MSEGIPFAWADKRRLRRIREQCEDYGSTQAVYLALCIVASDNGREEFQTTHAWLSSLSGFSERTVRSRLKDIQRIGAVQIHSPKLRAPCDYRLLPFGNDCRTSGNGCRALGKHSALPLPPSEEKKEPIEGRSPRKPLTTAERIGLEKRLDLVRRELTGHRAIDQPFRDEVWVTKLRSLTEQETGLVGRLR